MTPPFLLNNEASVLQTKKQTLCFGKRLSHTIMEMFLTVLSQIFRIHMNSANMKKWDIFSFTETRTVSMFDYEQCKLFNLV